MHCDALCRARSALCIVFRVLFSVYCFPCPVFRVLCSVYYVPCAAFRVLCSVYYFRVCVCFEPFSRMAVACVYLVRAALCLRVRTAFCFHRNLQCRFAMCNLTWHIPARLPTAEAKIFAQAHKSERWMGAPRPVLVQLLCLHPWIFSCRCCARCCSLLIRPLIRHPCSCCRR